MVTSYIGVFIRVIAPAIVVFCGSFITAAAQDSTASKKPEMIIKHQIALRHDNDFMTLTDRYYSFGLYATYSYRPKKGLTGTGSDQFSFELGQGAITPGDKKAVAIEDMDRPYVGFLTLNSGWSYMLGNSILEHYLLLGLGGPASGAGGFQRWYHNAVVVSDPPTWTVEMKNNFYLNLYSSFTREWTLAPNPFGVRLAMKGTLAYGSKDIFAQPEMTLFLGRRNEMGSSTAHKRIGSRAREIFFTLNFGMRWVDHNAFLQGSTFGDNYLFTIDPEKTVVFGAFDFKHRFEQNEYWFGYRKNSAETSNSEDHSYLVLGYARNF